MPVPTWSVQVGWTGSPTAPNFGGGGNDDITANVLSANISRGRSSNMAHMDMGSASLTLKDMTGLYNPENSGSALSGSLVPMKALRIRATFSAATYGLFYGFISRIEHDPGRRQSYIEAVDLFEWLSLVRPTIAEQSNKSPDYIIGLVLDQANWTDAGLRSLAASRDNIPSWSANGSKSAITLIQEILNIERGIFFVDGDGVATYQTRAIHYANGAAVATFDSIREGMRSAVEKDRIINRQSVTKTGGTEQTASDATSQAAYGIRDGSAISSSYLESDGVAGQLANFLVAMNKDPRSPARDVALIASTDALLIQQLSREIGDLVTVSEPQGGTSFTGRIQGIRHDIKAGALLKTAFSLQKVSAQQFTVGTSTIDGPDVIGW